ncbi:hypothetical protein ABTZ03_42180 [Kitasatospora sp. NPDC096077]|uniref:hypothetical protein n=1 Tax=Kitasatospora sp. NPDC096077 TaxID=3155544 RepID=UPI00332A2B34
MKLTVDLQIAGSLVVGEREVMEGDVQAAGGRLDRYTTGGFYVERGTVGTVVRTTDDPRASDGLGHTMTQATVDRLNALGEEETAVGEPKQLDIRLAGGFFISGVSAILVEKV